MLAIAPPAKGIAQASRRLEGGCLLSLPTPHATVEHRVFQGFPRI